MDVIIRLPDNFRVPFDAVDYKGFKLFSIGINFFTSMAVYDAVRHWAYYQKQHTAPTTDMETYIFGVQGNERLARMAVDEIMKARGQ